MRAATKRAATSALLAGLAFASVLAVRSPAQAAAVEDCQPSAAVVTHHKIMLPGGSLDYDARAERLPIRDGVGGQVHACMFYVAYSRPTATGRHR